MEKTSYHLFKWIGLLFLVAIIHKPYSSARVLDGQSPPRPVTHHPITFFMQDILSNTHHHLSTPSTHSTPSHKFNGQIPIPKPMSPIPPNVENPLPRPIKPTLPFTSIPGQNIDPSEIGLSFPTIATLQGLELGKVTTINEDVIQGDHNPSSSSIFLGKAKGVYVQSSDEDEGGHMMAMNVLFANGGFKDGLKFFGVHRSDVSESHIAVIGGTGKFHGANGYATVKDVTSDVNVAVDDENVKNYSTVKKFLLFTIYLSY